MGEGKPGPGLFGFGICGNHLLEVGGDLDGSLVLVEFHEDGDGVSCLALGAGSHLGINHHHVPVAHVHQRTTKGKTVDGAFDRHSSLALEDRSHVKWRLEDGGTGTGVTEKPDLELLLRHVDPAGNSGGDFTATA